MHVLLKGIFTGKGFSGKFNCFDMFVTMMPYNIVSIPLKLLKFIASASILVSVLTGSAKLAVIPLFFQVLVFEHFGVIPMAILLFLLEYRRLEKIRWYKALFYSLMFPLFGIVGDVATWIALFTKVSWKPIPHNDSVHIDEVEERVFSTKNN